VPYPTLLEDLHVGSRVQLGDGAISMRVVEVGDESAMRTARDGWRGQRSTRACICRRTRCGCRRRPRRTSCSPSGGCRRCRVHRRVVRAVADDIEQVREVVGDRARLVAKIETSAAVDTCTRSSPPPTS
jgi:pyruvate kinase